MKIAMVLIDKPNYGTRALRPFYVNDKWARAFELMKKARRLTDEEIQDMTGKKVESRESTRQGRRGRPRRSEATATVIENETLPEEE